MADIYLTDKQIAGIFVRLTKAMIGGSPAADVRQVWPTGGAPGWTIDQDVCFVRVVESGDLITATRDTEYIIAGSPSALTKKSTYIRVMEVSLIFYGPLSNQHANAMRDYLFNDESFRTLSLQDIFLIPENIIPRRVPELWQGMWYERYDLQLNFNCKTTIVSDVGYGRSVEVILNVVENNGTSREEVILETQNEIFIEDENGIDISSDIVVQNDNYNKIIDFVVTAD
jgi:hypothetical protein